jgi:hypothetical protein
MRQELLDSEKARVTRQAVILAAIKEYIKS